jgi:hypothetical protein
MFEGHAKRSPVARKAQVDMGLKARGGVVAAQQAPAGPRTVNMPSEAHVLASRRKQTYTAA